MTFTIPAIPFSSTGLLVLLIYPLKRSSQGSFKFPMISSSSGRLLVAFFLIDSYPHFKSKLYMYCLPVSTL